MCTRSFGDSSLIGDLAASIGVMGTLLALVAAPLWLFATPQGQLRTSASRQFVATVNAASPTRFDASRTKSGACDNGGRATQVEMTQIRVGRELFLREWVPDDSRSHAGDGLGPVYNDTSCVACHDRGGIGGAGAKVKNIDVISAQAAHVARAAAIHPGFGTAASVVLHRFGTTPEYSSWRISRLEESETSANARPKRMGCLCGTYYRVPLLTRSQRNPTPLFGTGLIDAIPDEVIEKASEQSDPDFPDIQGRANILADGRIGRFGWKAQVGTLREFVVTACAVELGLDVPDHPQGGDPLKPNSKAPGLDLNRAECDALSAFVSALPAPTQLVSAETVVGKNLFLAIGCGACHTPDLGPVEGIYSDLLLHDMGRELSDTGTYGTFAPETRATGEERARTNLSLPLPPSPSQGEWRTPPLWGVRDSGPYLHDGRAETLEQAIALHGGEGKEPSNRYFALTTHSRQRVQEFLQSLVAPAGPLPSD
jgi:CxxC motif-containing protein (DUF1111 family)